MASFRECGFCYTAPVFLRAGRFPCAWSPSWEFVSWRWARSRCSARFRGTAFFSRADSADFILSSDSLLPGGTVAKQNTARKSAHASGSVPQPVQQRTIPDLDRLIHERIRLGIVSALAVNKSVTFNELKKLLQTTDGNVSVHARKLEEANYIACTKSFEGRMPKTEYRLTDAGRRALEKYLNHMEALIGAMRER